MTGSPQAIFEEHLTWRLQDAAKTPGIATRADRAYPTTGTLGHRPTSQSQKDHRIMLPPLFALPNASECMTIRPGN